MLPSEVRGGWTPSPKKDNPLSSRMISGKVSVIDTIRVEAMFGKMCRP